MTLQVCPFHTDEDVRGRAAGDDGGEEFTCRLTQGHPASGPFTWITFPEPPASTPSPLLRSHRGPR